MRECGDRIRRERASPSSPRLVLRRVLVLSEGRQFREAAQALQKLGASSIAAVAADLPLDLLVEGLPHSAQLLETLFNKLIASGQRPNINAEQVVWQLVRLFASLDDPTLKTKVFRLAKALFDYQPDFHRLLTQRRKSLDQAIQGLGCHGLMQEASGLTHLHVALKNELSRHIDAYKTALHRLDELHLVTSDSKKPVDASHQRLLNLHHHDVQQRLIDNKTILTILDKQALQQLRPLIDTLATRVQNDKEALFCISQIKKLHPVDEQIPVAKLLMSFSKGCGAVLDLMQTSESPCSSEGYHSEPESECDTGRDAVERYAALYYQSRPRALEALDSLPDLMHATQLKSKILFSVVVLAFRTCKSIREQKIREVFHVLQVDHPRIAPAQSLREETMRYLSASSDTFPLDDAENQVRSLVCDTLREYKCLEESTALKGYVREVTRVAWYLVNQVPPYELDTDFQTPVRMQSNKHQRHHSADRTSDMVRSYLWPGLNLQNVCVYKAVVVTGNV
ncbi:uncharacterized protein LOC123312938 [Coccinella septempunctata]|uniref:uncharacterized protein LOC123312938 n=1 Tax=Coccinella septempunctata TaxID=41139 RepID=UPI001D08D3DF|nr:uncharacterized protein LOC123312938 [Coccinella septempunctata]